MGGSLGVYPEAGRPRPVLSKKLFRKWGGFFVRAIIFVKGETRKALSRHGREVSEFILSAAKGLYLVKSFFRNEGFFVGDKVLVNGEREACSLWAGSLGVYPERSRRAELSKKLFQKWGAFFVGDNFVKGETRKLVPPWAESRKFISWAAAEGPCTWVKKLFRNWGAFWGDSFAKWRDEKLFRYWAGSLGVYPERQAEGFWNWVKAPQKMRELLCDNL